MRSVQVILSVFVLCAFAVGCADGTSDDLQNDGILDAQVVAYDDQSSTPNTPVLNANDRIFVCVDAHVQGEQETVCDQFAELHSVSLNPEKVIRYTREGKIYESAVIAADSPIAKATVSRFESAIAKIDIASHFPRDVCVTRTKFVGHFVFDPSGAKHCCPTTTFLAAMGKGDRKPLEDDGFSESCCKSHEIWDGLGHCWDGNILPPSWTPPWLGDPMKAVH